RVDRGPRLREDGEELIGPRVDLAAASLADAGPDERPHVAQQGRVGVAEPLQQLGRPLDVGEEEGDRAAWQVLQADRARTALAILTFLAQLAVEEPERDDAVVLRRAQKPLACGVAGGRLLERRPLETRERVPPGGRVVVWRGGGACRSRVGRRHDRDA